MLTPDAICSFGCGELDFVGERAYICLEIITVVDLKLNSSSIEIMVFSLDVMDTLRKSLLNFPRYFL